MTLSSLFSLSVGITQAAIAGPVSNLFCTLSTSVIVLTLFLSDWLVGTPFLAVLCETQSTPAPRLGVPTALTSFVWAPAAAAVAAFAVSQCYFGHPFFCPPYLYIQFLILNEFFSGWIKSNIVARLKYTINR